MAFCPCSLLGKELRKVRAVAKSFCAAGARGGKSAGGVALRQAFRQIRAAHVGMNEARVKAVARAYGINRLNATGRRSERTLADRKPSRLPPPT